jgi:hypothetical protein
MGPDLATTSDANGAPLAFVFNKDILDIKEKLNAKDWTELGQRKVLSTNSQKKLEDAMAIYVGSVYLTSLSVPVG